MLSFLSIIPVFDDPDKRTIYELATVYGNSNELEKVIRKAIGGFLTEKQVKGKRLLFKPNWVKHSRRPSDDICLRTNDSFILATLKVFLEMGPSKILVGDAPIQGCNWDRMISGSISEGIIKLSEKYDIPIQIKDFRRRIHNVSDNSPESEIRPLSEYLIFDLGCESHLESITETGRSRFRVTNYDPDRMSSVHSPGIHKYCIVKDFFDADLVISLPKIKTHQKAGITGALKNIVGINGDKDFLPHHRLGGTKMGGDCYPGRSILRYCSELSLDNANRRQGRKSFWFWQKLSSLLWKLSFPGPQHNIAAGWYGNDTTWRMVRDLNRIALYGNSDGVISDLPQREVYSLCDGVIGGQGDGPLEPTPLPLGIIAFSNDSSLNDYAMALMMGLPVDKIPLLKNNLVNNNSEIEISLGGKTIMLKDLEEYSIKATPPKGWKAYLNEIK